MKYCRECGAEIMDKAVICPKCGCGTGYSENKSNINLDVKEVDGEKVYSKLVALLLWLFLGWIGAHRFYVGEVDIGAGYVLCLLFCWLYIPALIMLALWIYDLIQILANDHLGNSKLSW